MRIRKVLLKNFRCFGPAWTEIGFDEITCFVGPNGCGKSTVLHALARMFGTDQQRRFVREDFHIPNGVDPDTVTEASLAIEVQVSFSNTPEANELAADFWRHLTINAPGEDSTVRFYLQAAWRRANSPDGTIDQQLSFVQSPRVNDEDPTSDQLHRVSAEHRSFIQVHYVPATRDPAQELRGQGSGNLYRLIQALAWLDEDKASIEKQSKDLGEKMRGNVALNAIEQAVTKEWRALHTQPQYEHVKLQPVPTRFEDILRHIEPRLYSNELGLSSTVRDLSDGQRSLFHLGLVTAIHSIHGKLLVDAELAKAFDRDELATPHLTVLAIEEPENHLSPHYLGRIIDGLRNLATASRVQLALTSHSASILSRIEPTEIRHLRLGKSRTTKVNRIRLPNDQDIQKFIRGAVRAFPELYFAELVVLGEGDSEEIVLPHLLNLGNVACDASLISVVPLAGRHVNHMWRLLHQLQIPHVTLLDLDEGRHGGGWGRVQYALRELLALGMKPEQLPLMANNGSHIPVTEEVLGELQQNPNRFHLDEACSMLARHGVYFSAPLDFDWLLFQTFSEAYKQTASGQPHDNDPDGAIQTVMGKSGKAPDSLSGVPPETWVWYRYLFKTRSKPATHLAALEKLRGQPVQLTSWPPVLQQLTVAAARILQAGG